MRICGVGNQKILVGRALNKIDEKPIGQLVADHMGDDTAAAPRAGDTGRSVLGNQIQRGPRPLHGLDKEHGVGVGLAVTRVAQGAAFPTHPVMQNPVVGKPGIRKAGALVPPIRSAAVGTPDDHCGTCFHVGTSFFWHIISFVHVGVAHAPGHGPVAGL